MLHKWIAHIVLVLLFAFTQIGAATHEINHFSNATQQTQPDQHTSTDQCSQCLAYAQSAADTLAHAFIVPLVEATFQLSTATAPSFSSATPAHYSARAPPINLS